MTEPLFDQAFVRAISEISMNARAAEEFLSTFIKTPPEPVSASLLTRITQRVGQEDIKEWQRIFIFQALVGAVDCGANWKNAPELSASINARIVQCRDSGETCACRDVLRLQSWFFDNEPQFINDASVSLLVSLAYDRALDHSIREGAVENIEVALLKQPKYADDPDIFRCLKKLATDPDTAVSGAVMKPLAEVAVRCASAQWHSKARKVTERAVQSRDPLLRWQAKQAASYIATANCDH